MTFDELIAYKDANEGASQADAARHFKVAPQTVYTTLKRRGITWPRPPAEATKEKVCKFESCARPVTARGYCQTHYVQLLKGKELRPIKRVARRLDFLKSAVAKETDDCIIWPYGLSDGYGTIQYNGRVQGAHRVALILSGREPSEDKSVACHCPRVCTSRACVNPKHLRWDTQAENNRDTVRAALLEAKSRLNLEQVLEMRKNASYGQLAKRYGVPYHVIKGCMDRRTWKGFEPE